MWTPPSDRRAQCRRASRTTSRSQPDEDRPIARGRDLSVSPLHGPVGPLDDPLAVVAENCDFASGWIDPEKPHAVTDAAPPEGGHRMRDAAGDFTLAAGAVEVRTVLAPIA